KLCIKHIPTGEKEMRWFALTSKGGWLWGLKKAGLEAPPYQAHRMRKGEPLWLLNGEKAVGRALAAGVNAVCLPHGEKHWKDYFRPYFTDVPEVYLIADNDPVGARESARNASRLTRAGIPTRIVKLPDLPLKGDFYDWLESGRSVAEALKIIQDSPLGDPAV